MIKVRKIETGIWYKVSTGGGVVKFFEWDFESDKYLHQTGGYRTDKKSLQEIWFNTFNDAKAYSIHETKNRLAVTEKKYKTTLKELSDIESQDQAVHCLSKLYESTLLDTKAKPLFL